MEKLLTCEQVAERYSVKVITVWEWIRSKKLHAVKVGGRNYRIRTEDLEAFEKQNETGGQFTMNNVKEEVQKAVEALGYTNFKLEIATASYHRVIVFVNDERIGIYDTDKRTFVD